MTKDAFWLLVGVVVGAAGAIVGGVWAHRRQYIRDTRVRLHEELLPRVTKWIPKPEWQYPDDSSQLIYWKSVYLQFMPIDRAAKSLGNRDRRRVGRVVGRLEGMRDIDDAAPEKFSDHKVEESTGVIVRFGGDRSIESKYAKACGDLFEELQSYERWLARRIL